MTLNPARHETIFDPLSFGDRQVDVIGVGAVGSRVVLELARLGVARIRVWDDDVVSDVNLCNQAFGLADIGRPKTEAIADLVLKTTGTTIDARQERAPAPGIALGDVVFVLLDTMAGRKAVYQAVKMTFATRRLIESRMGVDELRVYSIDPNSDRQTRLYEATLYTDEQAMPLNACGSPVSVGATASVLAGACVWALITWWAHSQGTHAVPPTHETILGLRQGFLLQRDFNQTGS